MKKILIITTIFVFAALVLDSCTNKKVPNQVNNEIEKVIDKVEQHDVNYLQIGKEIALETKSNLAKHLVMAIGEKGPDGAIEFCNINAIPITDSMSLVLEANIKRVSDQPRNSKNQANEAELAYIKKWKEAKAAGQEQPPLLTQFDKKMVGYYPIITNQMCMQCHGKPNIDVNMATLTKIKKLYPTDKAIGYSENEIRGIFVVEMNKK